MSNQLDASPTENKNGAHGTEPQIVLGAKSDNPPKSRRWWLQALGASFSLLFVGVLTALLASVWFRSAVDAPGPLAQSTTIDIQRGTGVRRITDQITEAELIDEPLLFMLQVRLRQSARRLKAGEFVFPAHASINDVIDVLEKGKPVLYEFTVPEGLTSQVIAQLINDHPILVGDPIPAPPEGSVLPETYAFPRGYSRLQMLEAMQSAMQNVLLTSWQLRDTTITLRTPFEAAVLASIVEKETGVASERSLVASVFHNRLNIGMRLQSDPTVIYGLTGGVGRLGRPLRRADLKDKSPYNTYVHGGLPPTPITNPGRMAIEAVMRPEKSDYVYFVADGTGGHAFAKTLAEHNRNVAAWQKFRTEQEKQ